MDFTLTTPAILFPAVSLLLIAYTNRYLAIARLIRELKTAHGIQKNPIYLRQIRILKRRERFIRNMQMFAIASMFTWQLIEPSAAIPIHFRGTRHRYPSDLLLFDRNG